MSFTNNSRIVVGGSVQIKKDKRQGNGRSKQRGSRELEEQSLSLQLYAHAANSSAL